jgi:hypothetical protein
MSVELRTSYNVSHSTIFAVSGMNFNLPTSTLGTCWICGAVADSDEHKFKRSDMVTRYERNWPPAEQPFVFRGDGRPSRIQGPNSGPTLYRDMLCVACNNARTKPFDLAYERFSTWILSESATLFERAEIDFAEVFGNSYVEETSKLLCYFVKSLGCRIADSGVAPPPALCRILRTTGITDTTPFRVTFGINESWRRIDPSGRILGKGDLSCWPDGGSEPGFSWSETVGYFEIYHWYNVVWNPFPFGGNVMSGPLRTVTLGRRDQGDPANPPHG